MVARRSAEPDRPDLRRWNSTARAFPRHLLLHQLVERRAAAKPDAVAVSYGRSQLSYAALDGRARRWAGRLRDAGAGPDRLVGVQLERTPDLVAAMLGVLKAGAAYVPLDPGYPRERLDYIAGDAGLTALIAASPGAGSGLPVLIPEPLERADRPWRAGPAHRQPPAVAPGSLAYVLYTSGSTGVPKGVAITHASAVDLLFWAAETFGADLERVLASTSICFDCSILEIFGPLSWGGTVVLSDGPTDVVGRADRDQVRLLHTVPSIADDLLRTGRLPASVRTAIVGGEAFGAGLARRFAEHSAVRRLVNLYGPAECTSYASIALVDPASPRPPSIGRPVANTQIYLLDRQQRPVEAGEHGEIFIAGEGLARGYLHRPALTAERFVPEPYSGRPGSRMYRTGDLGRIDEQCDLAFLGRIDDQLKIHGVRVEPAEIAEALEAHTAVREAAVAATVTAAGRSLLTGYVAPTAAGAAQPEQLRAFLREKLPASLVPDVFVFLPRLPRLPNNKIDRRQLPAPGTADGAQPGPAGWTVRTAWEAALASLWAEAVAAGDVDIHADLFSLGGHSLAALRVRARLAELTGAQLPVRLFYEHPRIAAMAAVLERMLGPPPPLGARGHPGAWPPRRAQRARSLSPMQLAILSRSDNQADGPGLHLWVTVRLSGRLNAAALARTLSDIVRRHEILRATLTTGPDGQPLLAPQPAGLRADAVLPLADLQPIPPPCREEAARRAAADLVTRPIRPRAERPARFGLLRLADDDHVLVYLLHHIAGDAWSVETLSHQILAGYAAAIHGRPAAGGRPVQYADWAAEQQRRLQSPAGQAQYRRWRSRLAGPPVLRLPGPDWPGRPPVGSVTEEWSAVPADEVAALSKFGASEHATLYMVLTAVFAVLLHRWSGQPDLVIGMPHAGRVPSQLTSVIGPCQDAIPLRCAVAGEMMFRDIARQVRDRTLDAHADGDVPFITLAERFPAALGRHPLYQASIVLQHPRSLLDFQYRQQVFAAEPIGDLRLGRFLDRPAGETALDAELMLFERDGAIETVLACRDDAVTAADVSKLVADYVRVARAVAGNPDQSVAQLLPRRWQCGT
jgi:amino acid adenylation domain-containing protein